NAANARAHLVVIPPGAQGKDQQSDSPGATVSVEPRDFSTQILTALDTLRTAKTSPGDGPVWLVLDEARFDESAAMWEALTTTSAPCLWAFRGTTDPLRLRTAFGMSVRRAQQGIDQTAIYDALGDRLPFVARLARREGNLKLIAISEWQRDG